MENKQHSRGDFSTDIRSVDYINNGKFLNTTLWLYFPFHDKPLNYKHVDYGMLIDADFDKSTGYSGFEYQLEVRWDNQTRTWSRTLNGWSPNGDIITIGKTQNYTGFSATGHSYVQLSLDLNSITHGRRYQAVFYAKSQKEDNLGYIADFTRPIDFPPLEVIISTSPASLSLRPGEEKTIEVRVNSTSGYEPTVSLDAFANNNNITVNFQKGFDVLQIPSYGTATVPLTIFATEGVIPSPYTVVIRANSTLMRAPVATMRDIFPPISEGYTFSQSTRTVDVQKPLSLIERLGLGYSGIPINIPKEYLVGFYGIVLGFLVPGIARFFNARRQATYVSRYMTAAVINLVCKK
jgi:hypothetical protein